MARLVTEDKVERLLASVADGDAPRALGVSLERVQTGVVHLLLESCTVPEALAAAAALHAAGEPEEARAVLQAVLDQCVGLGGVPQGGQRSPGGLLEPLLQR